MILVSRPILNVESFEGAHGSIDGGLNLERAILEDFDEAGLERFRGHRVLVQLAADAFGFTRSPRYTMVMGDPKNEGCTYDLTGRAIVGLLVCGAERSAFKLDPEKNRITHHFVFDLNPEDPEKRYLNLFYSKQF